MRPWLVIVTGEPGTGKSSLAAQLATPLRLPVFARDAVRGGHLASAGVWRGELDGLPPREAAVDALVDIVEVAARHGLSAIVEFVVFAGRERAWGRLTSAANCVVIVLESADARARASARDRMDPLLNRPGVIAALGYDSVDEFVDAPHAEALRATMRTDFDLPTLRVRTDDGYDPPLESIVEWIVDQTRPLR